MDNQNLTYIIENFMLEHNRMASLIEFLINKLIETEIMTKEELGDFLSNADAFNMQIDNDYIPDPDTILNNLEMEG